MNIQTVIEHDDAYIINGDITVMKGSGHRFLIDIADWIAQGNTPEPYVEPPAPVPQSVTRRQGRLALLQTPHGEVTKLDVVEAALESISDPMQKRAALIEYDADTWARNNAFLQAMWAQLGGTELELDNLFRTAATL
ncbi:hypothetical protein G9Q38_07290 [Pusillimonas sp. DMV24BSW_D]|uniref:hypothetical protein n=1 Tax=Neopusillimonas aestuarii TaxID=2716226 RepID=UPI00140803EA|nr:hypothetical protein [Pusillimonas sp. DMV24BSW_D]QIM48998.1 hypothetical protein G9Q38_07290 [Pusillimonas sp. DMV24BSW_D]